MMNATKRQAMLERIATHGRQLLVIFPRATEKDPVRLCKKLRRLEAEALEIVLRMCNEPEMTYDERDKRVAAVLVKVNKLLGNVHEYQPKTGAPCGCRRGVERDNCPNCEGTGRALNFSAIRNRRPLVPIFCNPDPRGYALKIKNAWMAETGATLHQDWGLYGIIAPNFSEGE